MKILNILNNHNLHILKNSNLKLIRNFNIINRNNNKIINSNLIIKDTNRMSGFSLNEILYKLNEFAPETIAESWDNVGLLIEPHTPRNIQRIFLTNDLTENVLQEAISKNSDLIISYHPPIFAPFKRITQASWKERIASICLENRIALYSPHTAWDNIKDGINDWLTRAFKITESTPITQHPLFLDTGAGRLCIVDGTLSLKEAINNVKSYLSLGDVRVAISSNGSLSSPIKTIAVCAGSGSAVLKLASADLYITGEMSHHEILEATQNNTHVIICNHTNTERGYLKEFKLLFQSLLDNNIKINISDIDADPLVTH